jgi:hypothetical protein
MSATSFKPNEMIDIGIDPPWPMREFIERWLRQEELADRRRETGRFWVTLIVVILGTAAACIAAWPVVVPR